MVIENLGIRKHALIFFFIFSLLVILLILGTIIEFIRTGKVAEISATSTVTVKELLNIFNITVNSLQTKVNPGQTISANITVVNSGIYEGFVTIKWLIEDSFENILNSDSTVVNMSFGYSWNSIKSLFVPSNATKGIYYFKVVATAPGYYGSGNDTFEVFSVTITPGPPSAPPPPPYRELKKELEIYYPSKVIALVNSTKEFYVTVKNTGEVNITDLKLILEGLELDWFSIYPTNITLKPNETQVFIVKLDIPAYALKKDYPIIITLLSKEIIRSLQLTISVKKVFDYTELQEKLRIIKAELETLENESKTLEEKGIDIAEIKKLLTIIKGKLNATEKEIQAENPERASEYIYEIEELIDLLKKIIKLKKPVEISLWVFFSSYIILIIFILILILVLGLIYIQRLKTIFPTYTISDIISKINPGERISVHAELRLHAHGTPNIYALEDNSGVIYATSPKIIKDGVYTIEGVVKKEKDKKYIEIIKLRKFEGVDLNQTKFIVSKN
jgi:hypothetical protein